MDNTLPQLTYYIFDEKINVTNQSFFKTNDVYYGRQLINYSKRKWLWKNG